MILDIEIVVVGKLKKDYFRETWDVYAKMISPYTKLTLTEIPAESFNGNQKKQAVQKESAKLLQIIKARNNRTIFILDEAGKELSSENFSKTLHSLINHGITFIIGGSLGFSREIKQSNYPKLSLSKMTFPHELARIMLIEQLYRAITIKKNKSYHY